ncbi:MAG TPA: Uma2 family endonuclease [Pirellulales bacterium]|jgi:Uma2 family endonuclease|nr:Uma2 family endonuclease [Pirellulales bacterium]
MAIVNTRPPVEAVPRPFTAADLAEMPRELPSGPIHYELDNGRLIAMSPTGHKHGDVEFKIAKSLGDAAEDQRLGKIYTGETGIVLWRNPDRVVGADLAFVGRASLPVQASREGYLETIPDLVVEVVSKNDTAPYIQRKVDDYLKAGVRFVWVADPEARTLTEHRREAKPRTYAQSEIVTLPELIPGLRLSLEEVFNFQ